jgi:hypothetical protein
MKKLILLLILSLVLPMTITARMFFLPLPRYEK